MAEFKYLNRNTAELLFETDSLIPGQSNSELHRGLVATRQALQTLSFQLGQHFPMLGSFQLSDACMSVFPEVPEEEQIKNFLRGKNGFGEEIRRFIARMICFSGPVTEHTEGDRVIQRLGMHPELAILNKEFCLAYPENLPPLKIKNPKHLNSAFFRWFRQRAHNLEVPLFRSVRYPLVTMEFGSTGVGHAIQHELEGFFKYENEYSIPDDLLDEITTHITSHVGLSPDPELTLDTAQSTFLEILDQAIKSKGSLYLYGQDQRSNANRSLIVSKREENTVIEMILSYYDHNGREVCFRYVCNVEADLTEESKDEALTWIKDCFEKIKKPTDQWTVLEILMNRYKELIKEIDSQKQ